MENFILDHDHQPVPFKQQDWEKRLRRKRLSYDGNVVSKAEVLTWAQVEPALPKVGQAAQVDAWALSEGHMKEILANPDQVLLPRFEWPARFEQTRVMIQNDEEWDKLCAGLWARGVIRRWTIQGSSEINMACHWQAASSA